MDTTNDFERVPHTGGTVTFRIKVENGHRLISFGYQGGAPNPMALFGVHALWPQGIPVSMMVMQGVNLSAPAITNSETVPVMIASDKEGLFGRLCPSCGAYHRTSCAPPTTWCPYCDTQTSTHHFLTHEQRKYVQLYVAQGLEALQAGQTREVSLDDLATSSGLNAALPNLSEERQQTRFKCTSCGTDTDVVGRFGRCPRCGRRNSLSVFLKDLDALVARAETPRHDKSQRELRDTEWRNIVRDCVSAFEGFARDLVSSLAKLQATARRRSAIAEVVTGDVPKQICRLATLHRRESATRRPV